MGKSTRWFIVTGAFSAACAVALGAFGAHALKDQLSPGMQDVYRTAVLYHLFHSVGLLGVAFVCALKRPDALAVAAGWVMTAGILLFCGSLYLLAVSGVQWIGAVTPLGGFAMIAAWLMLAGSALRKKTARK